MLNLTLSPGGTIMLSDSGFHARLQLVRMEDEGRLVLDTIRLAPGEKIAITSRDGTTRTIHGPEDLARATNIDLRLGFDVPDTTSVKRLDRGEVAKPGRNLAGRLDRARGRALVRRLS